MLQVVYKRYASLYFVMGIDSSDNELITLELVHHFVEVLDRYFGNVCELDLIFNFHKVLNHCPRPPTLHHVSNLLACVEGKALKQQNTNHDGYQVLFMDNVDFKCRAAL